jgi:two-component system, NarL family, response regulator LiaR
METIRLIIVDDHTIVRQGLRAVMRVLPGMEVVGEASNGREALAVIAETRPDLVLLDLVMPELDGVATISAIKRAAPDLPVIALTTFAEADLVMRAVQAGADGYLLKDVDIHDLAHAIRTVRGGQPYLHPEATRHLLQAAARPTRTPDCLTRREQEVLGLVARGQTNREIARALAVAEKTISVHVSNILGKLGVSSRTQAALSAVHMGLVPLGDLASADLVGAR